MKQVAAVDLFAGAGGTSTGLALACKEMGKRPSLIAINHWPRAIETHKLNHPWALHICEDMRDVDPRKAVPSGHLDILVASPECVYFSRARGGKPINDQRRTPAFHILKWLGAIDVDSVLVENVMEWIYWGPLDDRTHKPIKEKRSQTFKAWIRAVRRLGYNVDYRVLNAADYGDATTRRRLFVMARKGKPIIWPEPTRSKTGGLRTKKWKGAKEVIDWSLPGESIFTRKKPLCANTIKRIMEGLEKFDTDGHLRPFLILMENGSSKKHIQSIEEPFPTITANTHGGTMAVTTPFLVTTEHGTEGRWGRPVKSVDDPLPTISTTGGFGIVEPFILPPEGIYRGNTPKSVDQPLGTVTQRGAGSLVEPFIIPNFGRKKNQKPRIHNINDPLPTVTGKGAGNLVQAFILSQDGRAIPRSTEEPLNTILGAGAHQIIQSFLTTYYKHGGASSVESPVPSVTTHDKIALVQPVINGYALDIRFRMLTPKELAGAMSFPEDYVFTGTRTEVVKQIGNAVAVKMAKALCMSLLRD